MPLRHGQVNYTTILALVMAVCFIAQIPLVAGLFTRRQRGWKKTAYWLCLLCWLVFVACVTFLLREALFP